MSLLEYLNPFSNEFSNIRRQFNQLSSWSKLKVVAFSILAGLGTVLLLGLGALACFRYSVQVLSPQDYSEEITSLDRVAKSHLFDQREGELDSVQPLIVQGSITQYNEKYRGEGRSACTSIALNAAHQLLEMVQFSDLNPLLIDEILDQGVRLYLSRDNQTEEHTSVENYNLEEYFLKREIFHEIFSTEDDPYSRLVNSFDIMIQDAETALSFPTAIITKSLETVALICRSINEFWLFDSHGDSEKKAFVQKYTSKKDVASALITKFPYLDAEYPDEAFLLDATYNTFNAYAVKLL